MNNIRIAIIGLGYVGLPLARLFATKYPVIGFDIDETRVKEINTGEDKTLEIGFEILKSVLVDTPTKDKGLFCSSSHEDINNANIYIITVPTPVDKNNRPNLDPLINASQTVGNYIKSGDIIIYESTVFPGATEEV